MDSERYDFIKDAGEIEKYERLTHQPQAIYWSRSMDGKSMMMVNRLPGGSDDGLGALTVTLDNKQLSNMLQTLSPYNGGTTFCWMSRASPCFHKRKNLVDYSMLSVNIC